ncbi:MAG: hypothetical protein WC998_05735 [Candidatus Paceibacterota bacterium]|jgi:hypothetical protein
MEKISSTASSGDIQNTFGTMSGMASPKLLYTAFLLGMCRDYFALMLRSDIELSNPSIDRATGCLIAFCPDKETRKKLWDKYNTSKNPDKYDNACNIKTDDMTYASIETIGDLIDFLTSVLDLSESANAGFL